MTDRMEPELPKVAESGQLRFGPGLMDDGWERGKPQKGTRQCRYPSESEQYDSMREVAWGWADPLMTSNEGEDFRRMVAYRAYSEPEQVTGGQWRSIVVNGGQW